MSPAVVWRFCLAGMIATSVIAILRSGTLCTIYVYSAEWVIQEPTSRTLEVTIGVLEPLLSREGFRAAGRTESRTEWLRMVPRPGGVVMVSMEDGSAHVQLMLHHWRRTKDAFLQLRAELAHDLESTFGEDRVRLRE